MDDDVNMDSPQISILREEATPPPARPTKLKVKLLVRDKPAPPAPESTTSRTDDVKATKPGEQDEEDQLIDDYDINLNPSSPKKKSSKRKSKKTDSQSAEDEKKRLDAPSVGSSSLLDPAVDAGAVDSNMSTPEPLSLRIPAKKAAPRQAPPAPKAPKTKPVPSKLSKLSAVNEDVGGVSEGYTGTATSSPGITIQEIPPEGGSPEPEHLNLLHTPTQLEENAPEPLAGPSPIYPLPTKPFPVQPPPKIGTGFAPAVTLDKSGLKPRKWRMRQREIRGIGGGRWFVRSWVGDKESEYLDAMATKSRMAAEGDKLAPLTLPKLPSLSLSVSGGKGTGKKGTKAAQSPLSGGRLSAGPSRDGSALPEPLNHMPRAPTKMRTTLTASSTPDIITITEDAPQSEPQH